MKRHRLAVVFLVALAIALAAGSVGRGGADRALSIARAPAFSAAELSAPAGDDWLTNGGSVTNDRYSSLNQINSSNVGQLKSAWKIHLNSGGTRAYSQEATPVVYQGVMYISTGNDDVFALDAATGKTLWTYFSHIPVTTITTACCGFSNRGVAIGDGKVYIAQITGQLVALDQQTGAVVWRTWNTRWQEGGTMTMAPLYYDGKVIVGISGGEMGARGAVTAYNASNGAQVWASTRVRPTVRSAAARGRATNGSTAAPLSGRRRVSIRAPGSCTSASVTPIRGRTAGRGATSSPTRSWRST